MKSGIPSLCLIDDCSSIGGDNAALVEENVSMLTDFNDVADLASGYVECMEEAIRYLIEVEMFPASHPAVESLKTHLDQYRKQLLQTALYRTTGISRRA
ncbi:Hypothetical protein NTJ_07231 [Nesidiocoris tenuis]|uniref:Orange domain-containing protein n=1 Tax=Nesidiocoris tenuis TaxID=355587 RepID=A0ABN7AQD6_9HEMI|nr:Hypothetical protein NTJ_07231 [Nesidiocoris tenuis]